MKYKESETIEFKAEGKRNTLLDYDLAYLGLGKTKAWKF